ncbi:glycosyltransferase family 2 protein [Micromonospora sp. DT229]|uniref:glycosyltransferase family 2 protein n=1 Tax=Micromonospora sp. DT229 TaxID=3393430 RepID=UPI003CF4C14A
MNSGNSPLVSVVIPCHNSAKTIALSVLSALHQTHPSVEVIVVDDASTDNTREIVGKLDCALIALTENVGAGPARNRGIAASRGDILFFLDSDVALAPEAVANAVKIFQENPSYGAVWGVYGDRPLVDDGVVEWVQVLYGHYRATRKLGAARTGHFASGAIPRWVIDEIGAFDERLLGQYANEDHEFSLRIAEHYPVIRTLSVIGYHDDDDQLSSILRKLYRRAGSLVPLVLKQRELKPEREATHRPAEVAAASLATASLPLVLVSPYLAAVPLAFLAWFISVDLPLFNYVRRTAGWRMVPPSVFLSFLYSLAISAGALSGGLRYVLDARFRQRYRTPVEVH